MMTPVGEWPHPLSLQVCLNLQVCTGMFWIWILVWLCPLPLFDLGERRDCDVSRSHPGSQSLDLVQDQDLSSLDNY